MKVRCPGCKRINHVHHNAIKFTCAYCERLIKIVRKKKDDAK